MSLRPVTRHTSYRGHVLEQAPAAEPVTAGALRAALAETAEALPDPEAIALIAEARNLIEETTGLAFITQDWRMVLDSWPGQRGPWWDGVRDGAISDVFGQPAFLELPRYPLQAVQSVTVFDLAGNPEAVDVAATFDVDTFQRPGRLALKFGATWPIAMRPTNAIQIVYRAGFGANVPPVLARAVKQVAAYLYSHRGDECDLGDAMAAAGDLLNSYAVRRL